MVSTPEQIANGSLKLLLERFQDGWWYHDQDAKLAEGIIAADSGKAAFIFLQARNDYEYEEFSLETFTSL